MSAAEPRFSAVVAAHDRPELLRALLESLRQAEPRLGALQALVVDSSGPGAAEANRASCGATGCEWLAGPLSVRAKRNLGASRAAAPWVLFIDSDCRASEDLLRAYEAAIARLSSLRVAAGPTVFRGGESALTRRLARSSLLVPFARPAREGLLPWATTSNLLVRRDVFEEVGGFREDFPFRLGGDDTDLCLRLRDAGHPVHAVPDAVCFHSWSTWSRLDAVARRSFRWGWMHARLMRDHPRYRRLDTPGLPVHATGWAAVAVVGALLGAPSLLLAPPLFVACSVLLHACFVALGARSRARALVDDLTLALVELPFGFGRVFGALAGGAPIGVLCRLDIDDAAADATFPDIVRALWSDHLASLGLALAWMWAR